MKIATWNVNSARARVGHLLKYLDYAAPDVLCMQETKVEDGEFPCSEFEPLGYSCLVSGQKSYNGVAILTRLEAERLSFGFPSLPPDHELNVQKRLIHATIGGVRIICAYFPNGEEVDSDKFHYKLNWFAALRAFLAETLAENDKTLLCGDFNVAPEDADLWNPEERAGQILVSPAEREALEECRRTGFTDLFRRFHPEAGRYSWWDYRGALFWKGKGMRLDHMWASAGLAECCTGCDIDERPRKWPKPSDHTPVWAEFSF